MNMQLAREWVNRALDKGLRLHGVSAAGKPAISFDLSKPDSETLRRRFNATEGLVREQLRAAMIEACQKMGLPCDLSNHTDMPRFMIRPADQAALH